MTTPPSRPSRYPASGSPCMRRASCNFYHGRPCRYRQNLPCPSIRPFQSQTLPPSYSSPSFLILQTILFQPNPTNIPPKYNSLNQMQPTTNYNNKQSRNNEREYQLVTVLHWIIQFSSSLPYNTPLFTLYMKEERTRNLSEKSKHVKSQNYAQEGEANRFPLLQRGTCRNRLAVSVQKSVKKRQRAYSHIADRTDLMTKTEEKQRKNTSEIEKAVFSEKRANTVMKERPMRYKLKKFMKEIHSSAVLIPLIREKQRKKDESMNFVEVYVPLLPRRHQKDSKLMPIHEEKIDIPSSNYQSTSPIIKETSKNQKRYSSNSSYVLSMVIQQKAALTADPNHKNLVLGQIKKQILYSLRPPRKKDLEPIRRKIRKIFNVVLFTVYLHRYSRLIRSKRQHYITTFRQQGISDQILNLTSFFLQGQKRFADSIALHSDINYHPMSQDSVQLQEKKLIQLRRLLQIEIECINKSVKSMIALNFQDELVYHLCKHGNYSVAIRLHTQQELDILCLSQTEGYIRADQYLQKSGLIMLIFIKIIIYSILLRPESLQFQANQIDDPSKLFINIKLIANILYELLIEIQDTLLEKCGENYRIGNWNHLKNTFNVDFANSMTLIPGKVKKNELITGFMDQRYIQKTFRLDELVEEKRILAESVQQLHYWLKKYHNRFRTRIF